MMAAERLADALSAGRSSCSITLCARQLIDLLEFWLRPPREGGWLGSARVQLGPQRVTIVRGPSFAGSPAKRGRPGLTIGSLPELDGSVPIAPSPGTRDRFLLPFLQRPDPRIGAIDRGRRLRL
jgi:hypothetical protein